MANLGFWPLLVAIAITLGVALQRQLNKAAQPLRLELADKGEHLLAQADVPVIAKRQIRYMLDTAFHSRFVLLIAIVVMPVIAVYIIIAPKRFIGSIKNNEIQNSELRALHHDLMELHDKITMVNHPLLWLILQIDMLIFIATAVLIAGALRGYLPNRAIQDSIMKFIESQRMKMQPPWRRDAHPA